MSSTCEKEELKAHNSNCRSVQFCHDNGVKGSSVPALKKDLQSNHTPLKSNYIFTDTGDIFELKRIKNSDALKKDANSLHIAHDSNILLPSHTSPIRQKKEQNQLYTFNNQETSALQPSVPKVVHSKKENLKMERSINLFKSEVAHFVKEVLKPIWREGKLSKEAFKTIVKRTVEKTTAALPPERIPSTPDKVETYLASSQKRIYKLIKVCQLTLFSLVSKI